MFMSSTLQASVFMVTEILRQIYIPSKIQERISQWNRCLTYLQKLIVRTIMMRSMEWSTINWEELFMVMKYSSVSCTQRSTCSQNLCCVLERWTRTISQTLHGKTHWRGSKVHRNTELWTDSDGYANGKFEREHLHRIHHIAALPQKSKSYCHDWAFKQKISLDGLSSCRCSTTSHGDLKTIEKNAN